MNKTCSTCKETKPLSEFGKSKNNKFGVSNDCKVCARAWSKKYRETYPDKYKDSKLKTTYGITLADFNRMLEEQRGVCAICHRPEAGKALAVDHCHKTGKVRALLCSQCNTMLGKAEDNPDRLRNAALYLERFLND